MPSLLRMLLFSLFTLLLITHTAATITNLNAALTAFTVDALTAYQTTFMYSFGMPMYIPAAAAAAAWAAAAGGTPDAIIWACRMSTRR